MLFLPNRQRIDGEENGGGDEEEGGWTMYNPGFLPDVFSISSIIT